jgi:RecA-family ATPase
MEASLSTNGAGSRRARRDASPDREKLDHALNSEASIIGGVILRNEVLAELGELSTSDFYDAKHKVVWEAVRNLEAAGRPIDVVTLEHEIEKAGKLDAIGGVAFLGDLALRVPTVDNVLAYADIVMTASRNRRALLALSSVLERAKRWPHDPGEMIAELAGELSRLEYEGRAVAEKKRARWVVDFDKFLGDEEPDDDDAIDWVIRDLVPRGEPALWGGPMKGGKTWSALDLMLSVALGQDWLGTFKNTLGKPAPVVGVLLEDNIRRLRKRVWELTRARGITPNDDRLLANMHVTRSSLRLPDVAEQRRFITELKTLKPALVVIDNLTRVLVGDPNSTRDAAAFSRAWTEICEETGACVMFLHHTKKQSGDPKANPDPFEQLRGSNDFGAAARNIIVTTPIRNELEHLSEIRMRGNLDLRRDSFVLGFERKQLLDRWRAHLSYRGDVAEVKDEAAKQQKELKTERRKAELQREAHQRRERAIAIARAEGGVSSTRLARELGLKHGHGTPAETLRELHREGVMRTDRIRGYVLADAHVQGDLPVEGTR